LGNAIKFTASGTVSVTVSYDAEGKTAHFAVEDTGEGIAPQIVDKVFDQFFQDGSSLTRRHGGSGLGLAISKQLVGMMGGKIGVVSELGVGSTFSSMSSIRLAMPGAKGACSRRRATLSLPRPSTVQA
jgi:signal transduction histidine kinase